MSQSNESAEFDRVKATLDYDAPVTVVSTVSAKRAQALRKLGIRTVRDLINNFPRRYVDMSHIATIASAKIGEFCTIKARVYEVKIKKPKPRLVLAEVTIVDDTGTLVITAFRQPWLADQLKAGLVVAVSGKVEFNYGFKRMTNPYIESLEDDEATFSGMILPIHPLTGSIKAGLMRRFIMNALEKIRGIIDPLPLQLRDKYRLYSRQNALSCIHFPKSMEEQRQARRRLAYEEVLLLELSLMQKGKLRAAQQNPTAHVTDGPHMKTFEKALPFTLTQEQVSAREDILNAMQGTELMNMMLLGDVGTGKTIVAAHALVAVADSGTQALFMAPTEILANQHAQSLGPLLLEAGVTSAVLTGSTSKEQRKALLVQFEQGKLSVLFGTHALLEPDVKARYCSLVIIDEQQRFGVDQRQALLDKGTSPDVLYLTATPIPRTLALALFGDMTLSYLKERPRALSGRTTRVLGLNEKGLAYDTAQKALERGEQVYIVCPLVGVSRESQNKDNDEFKGMSDLPADDYPVIQVEDDSDMVQAPLSAARSVAEFLQAKVFVDQHVGLIHGKLPAAEKSQVMDDFRSGIIDVLVATTVIEVGVDVPNATVMIIEDADRFGLAQLHQLRGRVGRGDKPGEVLLISGTKNQTALERLAAMQTIEDGFELASYDLSLRREGDILGNRQHGASSLKLVNVVRDKGLIEAAWSDARSIVQEDPTLSSDLYKPLAREMEISLKED